MIIDTDENRCQSLDSTTAARRGELTTDGLRLAAQLESVGFGLTSAVCVGRRVQALFETKQEVEGLER